MSTKKQKYITAYNKENYKQYSFRVKRSDTSLIEKLDSIDNKNGYLTDLINKDINGAPAKNDANANQIIAEIMAKKPNKETLAMLAENYIKAAEQGDDHLRSVYATAMILQVWRKAKAEQEDKGNVMSAVDWLLSYLEETRKQLKSMKSPDSKSKKDGKKSKDKDEDKSSTKKEKKKKKKK